MISVIVPLALSWAGQVVDRFSFLFFFVCFVFAFWYVAAN